MKNDKILENIADAYFQKKQRTQKINVEKKHKKKYHHDKHGMEFILDYLYDNQDHDIFPNELCQAMNVSAPRVTAILRESEKEGDIVRQVSENDKRMIHDSITKKGAQSVMQRRDRWNQQIQLLIERIGEEDAKALVRILNAYNDLKNEGLWK